MSFRGSFCGCACLLCLSVVSFRSQREGRFYLLPKTARDSHKSVSDGGERKLIAILLHRTEPNARSSTARASEEFSVRVAKKKGPSAFVLMMCLFDSGGEIRESAAQSVEQAPFRVLDNGLAAVHKMTIFSTALNV